MSEAAPPPASAAPLFSFGLLADIQYADKPTISFDGRPQRYRESLAKLSDALADFSSRCSGPVSLQQQQQPDGADSATTPPAASTQPPLQPEQQTQPQQHLQFVLTLGDLIDGKKFSAAETSLELQLVAGMLDHQLPRGLPVWNTLGNHCRVAAQDELLKALHMPHSYYSVPVCSGWRLVVLDTTEMSLHSGYPANSPQMQQARQWAATHPISKYSNARSWNGGCTKQQLAWLQQQLVEARQRHEQVLVACHHPIAPGSAPDEYLAWGNDELLEVLCGPAGAGIVHTVFSGHYHPGGCAQHGGVHFVVLEGMLEAPADSNAYAVVDVYPSGVLKIAGNGVATSRELLPLL